MGTEVRMCDASMTYTEAGNYDFVTAELLIEEGHSMRVGLIRARTLLGHCCSQRENHLAVMCFLMKIVQSVLVGRRRGFIRRRDVAVLASLSTFSFPGMPL